MLLPSEYAVVLIWLDFYSENVGLATVTNAPTHHSDLLLPIRPILFLFLRDGVQGPQSGLKFVYDQGWS